MRARDLLLMLPLCASPVAAQDVTSALEMSGHRALMRAKAEASLAPFTTDGCSGGLSYSWSVVAGSFPQFAQTHDEIPPWEGCCVTHDRAYHDAGEATTAEQSFQARLTADEALRVCVTQTGVARQDVLAAQYETTPEQVGAAYETIANAMYLAVRFGGGPCSGLPWRWGYGYPGCTVLEGLGPVRE